MDWLIEGTGSAFDVVDKAVQKEIYDTIRGNLGIFLNFHKETASMAVGTLRKQYNKLSPELCPPEILNQLREILKIPDEELFSVVREALAKFSGREIGRRF